MIRATAALLSLVFLLAACSGDEEGEPEQDVEEVIKAVGNVAAVDRVVDITEGNNANRIPGRNDRLLRAMLFYDSRLKCRQPGIECGAILEEWPDADAARAQSEYIQALQAGGPGLGLGKEHHHREGALLLRIAGDLKAPQVEEYAAAFRGEAGSQS